MNPRWNWNRIQLNPLFDCFIFSLIKIKRTVCNSSDICLLSYKMILYLPYYMGHIPWTTRYGRIWYEPWDIESIFWTQRILVHMRWTIRYGPTWFDSHDMDPYDINHMILTIWYEPFDMKHMIWIIWYDSYHIISYEVYHIPYDILLWTLI